MAKSRNRAVVTGIGIVAANALSQEEFLVALTNGISGLRSTEMLEKIGVRTRVAGEVNLRFPELEDPEEDDRAILMAYKVIDEAYTDSGITREEVKRLGPKAGISIATAMGGNLRFMKYTLNKTRHVENSPEWLIGAPVVTSRVPRYAGIKGPIYTSSSACAAGTGGAGIALDLIRNGKTELMVVVGVDPLTEFSAAGFHSLKTLSVNGCKPFDKDRDGMTLGEGAAAIIVESLERASQRGAHIYGEILGYGLGNDAHHMTSPDPEGTGACHTLRMALGDAHTDAREIGYINMHGTGTELNDIMEINALVRLYPDPEARRKVYISSTKSMTGHCLGAAGSIELVVTLLALDRNLLAPTVGFENPMEDCKDFVVVQVQGIRQKVKKAMSNSFAFAGHSASIIVGKLEKPDDKTDACETFSERGT
jgi:3-oxoacyl-[acyl-carrier-protein] synthase II